MTSVCGVSICIPAAANRVSQKTRDPGGSIFVEMKTARPRPGQGDPGIGGHGSGCRLDRALSKPDAGPDSSSPRAVGGATFVRLRITADAERQIRAGHPWLFAESVREQNRAGATGELAVIYDRQNRFLAVGLFDPGSPLRVRVLHAGKPQTIDEAWWKRHLEKTLGRRDGLFDERTNGYRWINGESDGWPGLVLDRYDRTLVFKLYTAAWLPRLESIARLVAETLRPDRMALRLSRNIQENARKHFRLSDGMWLDRDRVAPPGKNPPAIPRDGESSDGPVVFQETGLRFEADVLRGQKTGFFLDQRDNRRLVESLARGRTMLNAFSFSGGFSLYAARGGATSVTDLDISAHALASARRNFAMNGSDPAIAACRQETIQADAFAWLATTKSRRFDVIVLDPPSLAKRDSERSAALEAYAKLTRSAIAHLRSGGILVAASCSAHVPARDFFPAVHHAAVLTRRDFSELGRSHHPLDHPATFPEAEYLKCLYLRFDPGR